MDLPFSAALCRDRETETCFSAEAEVKAMLVFEACLAQAQADCGLIPSAAAQAIAKGCETFTPDYAALTTGLLKDGVLGPGFIAALRQTLPEEARRYLHFGATSQDLTDSALTYRLGYLLRMFDNLLAALLNELDKLEQKQGSLKIMAQTRMQAALPISVADKLASWQRPLHRHQERLKAMVPRLLVIQFGGPVGNRAELGENAEAIVARLAARMNLGNAPCWHNARDNIVAFGNDLALITGTLGKIGQDAALLAQTENASLKIAGGGVSSAMAHKANPVTAELLVALARYAAGLAGTLNQAMIHENERSGAAWTLEWFTLPPLASATATALRHAIDLTQRLTFQPLAR